jgi:hypothetical protein
VVGDPHGGSTECFLGGCCDDNTGRVVIYYCKQRFCPKQRTY